MAVGSDAETKNSDGGSQCNTTNSPAVQLLCSPTPQNSHQGFPSHQMKNIIIIFLKKKEKKGDLSSFFQRWVHLPLERLSLSHQAFQMNQTYTLVVRSKHQTRYTEGRLPCPCFNRCQLVWLILITAFMLEKPFLCYWEAVANTWILFFFLLSFCSHADYGNGRL